MSAGAEQETETKERARQAFGSRFAALDVYATALASEGVRRGLIGPRELPRLWERHLLNSAALEAFLPETGVVIDVGSGAGLPGVVLACLRPDLEVVLLEPMERRVVWLTEVAETLALPRLRVVRGRAEELHGRLRADVVTARAVAPLDRLVGWTLPLLHAGGVLLALKGSRAAEEVVEAASEIERLGGAPAEVVEVAPLVGLAPTTVVRVAKVSEVAPAPQQRRRRRR